jgi:serine/threonine protein kinase
MGEVYRARDSRLDRIVAVKVLPEHLSNNPQLRERFEREAKAISSLSHPHICPLFDVGHQDGIDYLVMEHLEGETLASRLKKGPLPPDQVLQYAVQITDALDTAHVHAVVHRDLKPGNIMLTKTGAKLLDFGLAKVRASEAAPGMTAMPTQTTPLTGEGTILGTLQYMAPEQLEGVEADARTDIFALGAMIYEMATARKAFAGKSEASLISAIMTAEPPALSTVQAMTPLALDHVVKTCLAKGPNARWQTAHDVLIELKWIAEKGSSTESSVRTSKSVNPRGRFAWVAGVLAGALVTGLIVWRVMDKRPAPQPLARFSITAPTTQPLATWSVMALSLDGTRLVYTAGFEDDSRLYLRPIDRFEATPMRGTEGASWPFFSPDGLWVGFFAADKLKKVRVTGGVAQTICEAVRGASGADWAPDDDIFFGASGTGLWRVPASGGRPQAVTSLDKKKGEFSHLWPHILPGANAVLFTVEAPRENFHIAVESLTTHERRNLIQRGTYGRYASSGHLIYAWEGSLLASAFDLGRLKVTGPEIPLLENLRLSADGSAQFALSGNGSLVYAAGGPPPARTLVWVDRHGNARPLPAAARGYNQPRLSPDGQRLALEIEDAAGSDIWIYDLMRDVPVRLTYDRKSVFPRWSPDGKHLVFSSTRSGVLNLFVQTADGSGQAEQLFPSEVEQWVGSWSRDGRMLTFVGVSPTDSGDIWVLPLQGERKPQPFLRAPFTQYGALISPDGRWLAYVSDESGRFEVYVTSFPSGQGKWQISTEGGTQVIWAPTGRELFWRNGDKVMTAGVEANATFAATKPLLLFSAAYLRHWQGLPDWDITPDGQRFIMIKVSEAESAPTQVNVVLNWFEELKNKSNAEQKR